MTLIGLDKQLKELENFVKNFKHLSTKVAILWGSCGVGKTASVYHVAEKLGYQVVEFNASDDRTYDFFRTRVKAACCNPSFTPTIVLLDEFEDVSYKAQQYFAKIMKRIVKPTILTTNDVSSIYHQIRKNALEIFYPKPQIEHVIKFAKQHGYSQFDKIKDVRDFRQVRMIIEHESDAEGYVPMFTQKERILQALKSGDYSIVEKSDLPIILDTVSANLNGVELWRFIESLRVFDLTERSEVMSGLKVRASEIVNSFYTKLEEMRKEG